MVNRQINQEIELYTTPGKQNKEKSNFTRKGGREIFTFLVYFQKQWGIIFVFW
jgi:hypothetical protein